MIPLCFYFCDSLTFGGYYESRLEKAMAPHSSTLAWKIPQMEEPGGPPEVRNLAEVMLWLMLGTGFQELAWILLLQASDHAISKQAVKNEIFGGW